MALSRSGKNGDRSLVKGKTNKENPIIESEGKSLFVNLGIIGRLKMVAIAIFAVLATMESMFWAFMLLDAVWL